MLRLSKDQKQAFDSILDWYLSKQKSPYITLGGYAGTGKTTLISKLRKELSKKKYRPKKKEYLKAAFISYTGKAARVLRIKLVESDSLIDKDFVGTIHSLIYSPIVDDHEEIIGWEKKDRIDCDLVIVDEASMVSEAIWHDLSSYEKPIIAVGDHGQLPPIEGRFNLMENPVLRLEKIHRQAEKNPIIRLSILAREEGKIPSGDFTKGVRKILQTKSEEAEEVEDLLTSYKPDTMVLCGFNHTRVKLNNFIRQNLGFESPAPSSGDRVICLRNNHVKKVFNGMLGTIKTIRDENEDWYFCEIDFDNEETDYNGLISKKQFGQLTAMNFSKDRVSIMAGDLFDFGYALTVHKAQGSQARKVILFEERFSRMDDMMWRRWLYTGVTRAEEELYVIGR